MRVLLTHQWYPPTFGGGGEYLVSGIARRLQESGAQVRVLTAGDPKQDSWEGVPVTRLPIHRYGLYLSAGTIAKYAKDADIVQTFTYHASAGSLFAARRAGKPIVCMVLGIYGETWKHMKGNTVGWAIGQLEKRLVTLPYDRVVVLSDVNKREALAFGVPEERMRVIEPAVDIEDFTPTEPKKDYVLFASKLEPRKGYRELIAAARALPHVNFRVLGWGDGEAELRALQLPNLEFLGFRKGDDFTREFREARIFLMPSRAEGFPLVLIHAMAAGCAIVCTLPHKFAGERVEPGDTQGLIAGIERLWSDRDYCERLARENLMLSKEHSWDRHMGALMKTYSELVR